jgi:hypothetical protein
LVAPDEILVRVRLTGEGETWNSVVRFRLSEDGSALTDVTRGDEHLVRHRCR